MTRDQALGPKTPDSAVQKSQITEKNQNFGHQHEFAKEPLDFEMASTFFMKRTAMGNHATQSRTHEEKNHFQRQNVTSSRISKIMNQNRKARQQRMVDIYNSPGGQLGQRNRQSFEVSDMEFRHLTTGKKAPEEWASLRESAANEQATLPNLTVNGSLHINQYNFSFPNGPSANPQDFTNNSVAEIVQAATRAIRAKPELDGIFQQADRDHNFNVELRPAVNNRMARR